MKFKCTKCGHTNEINIGSVLGSRTSEAKREAARLNASKPVKPGSRPRGNPGTWNVAETSILESIIQDFAGRPTRAYKKHPEWKRRLLKDHTEGAVYAKIQYMKSKLPEPILITPPIPPPPSAHRQPDHRIRRGAGVAPKANDLS